MEGWLVARTLGGAHRPGALALAMASGVLVAGLAASSALHGDAALPYGHGTDALHDQELPPTEHTSAAATGATAAAAATTPRNSAPPLLPPTPSAARCGLCTPCHRPAPPVSCDRHHSRHLHALPRPNGCSCGAASSSSTHLEDGAPLELEVRNSLLGANLAHADRLDLSCCPHDQGDPTSSHRGLRERERLKGRRDAQGTHRGDKITHLHIVLPRGTPGRPSSVPRSSAARPALCAAAVL